MKIQLDGVAETLLITVRVRAEETVHPQSALQDPYAVNIMNQLQFDESNKNTISTASRIGVVARTLIFDDIVTDFLKRNPDGVIVDLGCGLDARYERLNIPETDWYDFDVEEAIDVRKKFFQDKNKYRMIAKSMFDYTWMDVVPKDRPILILSEGVMMYFKEEELRPLFQKTYDTFGSMEMAFDAIPPFIVKRSNLHPDVKKYNATFSWGLDSAEDLKKWDNRIAILGEKYYGSYLKNRWTLFLKLMMLIPKFRKCNRVVLIGRNSK
jgi:O-methyltransferase involved in polyketide biosynthesis